jgi:hypothetical protein
MAQRPIPASRGLGRAGRTGQAGDQQSNTIYVTDTGSRSVSVIAGAG